MSSNPPTANVTITEFATSLVNNLRNNAGSTNALGQGASQNIINFVISWCHQEGGGVTNAAKFNPLNTKQTETGSTDAGNGIQAYPDSTTGLKATQDALNNGRYPNLVHALATNDEINLGFTVRGAPSFAHMMANNIATELAIWVSGSPTLTSNSQQYVLSIMQGAGIPDASIEGGNQQSGKAGNSAAAIAAWGDASLGQSITGTSSGSNPFSTNDILKIAGGVLLVLVGVALFIKMQVPNSAIAKAIPFKV